jgi:hypothetical protein
MNETPFPFTVSATRALGTSSGSDLNVAKTSRSAAWSWPERRSTCQPNARSFA